MPHPSWSLQDAKNRFSAVVDAALAGEPQLVTRHGKRAVVVLAAEEFERLSRLDRAQAPTFAELLLAIPQDDGEFERATVRPRDVEL
jgi:antitoxin Phd